MKRKDRMTIRAGIHLSYKQEITKIINEYPNDKNIKWKGHLKLVFVSVKTLNTHWEKHFLLCERNMTAQ